MYLIGPTGIILKLQSLGLPRGKQQSPTLRVVMSSLCVCNNAHFNGWFGENLLLFHQPLMSLQIICVY